MRTIYLDNVSTTLLDPRVREAMLPWLEAVPANPLSPHSAGRRAREAVEASREDVARLVGCSPQEVLFTGSATEANNLALKGILRARGRKGNRLLVGAIEHPSVLHPARTLAGEGIVVDEIPVDPLGRVLPERLEERLDGTVRLVSVQHGNPEVGTLQPIEELARLAGDAGSLFHTDATLTAGILPGIWDRAPIHLLTLTPHLFHGPHGIAALVVRNGTRLRPQVEGGTQEGGRRAGTESVAAVVGFGEAARIARGEAPDRARRLRDLATSLGSRIRAGIADCEPTGDPVERVPGHLSLCVRFVDSDAVVSALDDRGILAGSGSPCSREAGKPSHVLHAMGVDPVLARGAITFAFSAASREEDVEAVAGALPGVVVRLRDISPLTPARVRESRRMDG